MRQPREHNGEFAKTHGSPPSTEVSAEMGYASWTDRARNALGSVENISSIYWSPTAGGSAEIIGYRAANSVHSAYKEPPFADFPVPAEMVNLQDELVAYADIATVMPPEERDTLFGYGDTAGYQIAEHGTPPVVYVVDLNS